MSQWSWWTRRRFDLDEEDFKEEIRAHLAMAEQERIADGTDRVEARYAALREFGNLTRTTEATRRVWTPRWLELVRDLAGDVRYACRMLSKSPAFTATVVGVLTLGIGLNAAVFSMLKGVALSPIAGVSASTRLALVHGESNAGRPIRISYPDYARLRDHNQAFAGLFGTTVAKLSLGRGRGARQVWGELVTGNYFELLGVGPLLGRTLLPADEAAAGQQPVVVISHGLWQRDFGSDRGIIGRTLEVNNQHLTVVGVADPAFVGTTVVYDVELFVPVTIAPQLGFTFGSEQPTPSGILADPDAEFFYPYGYLRPGVTLAEAAAHVQALWTARTSEQPADVHRLTVIPFLDAPNGAPSYILPTLRVLVAMGLLVLAVACANIAGLVLVRGVSRRGEIGLRLALGASRARVVRLLLIENVLLAVPGALFGLVIARHGLPVLVSYAAGLSSPLRIHFNVGVDALVVTFALASALGSALLFGFLPALRASRVELMSTINEDASPRGSGRGQLRGLLVVAQVAVSVTLLVAAGLAARSLDAARRADPGFDPDGMTAVTLDLKQNGYDEQRGRLFYRRLLEALASDPRIESSSMGFYVPLNVTATRVDSVGIEGYQPRNDEDLAVMSNIVGPDYFRTLGVPLLAGRGIAVRDDETSTPVLVVNRTFAERFYGAPEKAIGRRVMVAGGAWKTIVGVAGDIKYLRIEEGPRPYFYVPLLQAYRSTVTLHTRGRVPVERQLAATRAHLERLDPDLPVLAARPMRQAIRGAFIFLDLSATMLFVFGVAGIALAMLGTYGVVSYAVKQSTHEIGIRMALGASRPAILLQFCARAARLGAAGALIGGVAALGAGTLLKAVLFGVSPASAAVFAEALVGIFIGIAMATIVPAWRAARTDPLEALRHR